MDRWTHLHVERIRARREALLARYQASAGRWQVHQGAWLAVGTLAYVGGINKTLSETTMFGLAFLALAFLAIGGLAIARRERNFEQGIQELDDELETLMVPEGAR